MSKPTLLSRIDSPHQLRRLSIQELADLAEEMRSRIIDVVSRRGGHLASNLGVCEMTIALHHVFDFTTDRLLWDVGHQCYAHKMLTGRAERFDSLRQAGGLSGFPSPGESPYDLFSTGHAGTAISTATGLALADQALGRTSKTVAVVGDASISNGLSFEAINNAGLLKRQFLVILNDNSMAIDVTHGALAGMLDNIRMTHTYTDLKQSAENLLKHIPLGGEIHDVLKHIREGLRTTIYGDKVFEPLGFTYFGPIDGHDVRQMIRVLERVATIDRPVLLHVHTEKGRGCEYAVEDPCRFHSPSAYQIRGGKAVFPKKPRPTWTEIFSDALLERGRQREGITAITAAMPDGTGLAAFRDELPDRYFDVGISESHAVAMAAGMAKSGLQPVVAIYSTFMQRAFDQVFHEVALQKLPVILCMDRAGLVGSDGAVHHGAMDIAMLRPLPGMVLAAPADGAEMDALMDFALDSESPIAMRYPRDEVPKPLPGECPPFQLGVSRTVREGGDVAIIAYGATVDLSMRAAQQLANEGIEAEVVNARFAKPLDSAMVGRVLRSSRPVLIAEDHDLAGGLGSAILELAVSRGLDVSRVRMLGIPDRFVRHGSRSQQLQEVGLTPDSIAETLRIMHRDHAEGSYHQPYPGTSMA